MQQQVTMNQQSQLLLLVLRQVYALYCVLCVKCLNWHNNDCINDMGGKYPCDARRMQTQQVEAVYLWVKQYSGEGEGVFRPKGPLMLP